MAKQFSLTILIVAIVATAVGTCVVSLLACYLVTRGHRAKQQAHDEEKEVNDALDRAIVSYIVKELPSPHGSRTTQPPEPTDGPEAIEAPQPPEPAMTTAVAATLEDNNAEDYFQHQPSPQHSPQYHHSIPYHQSANLQQYPPEPPTPTGDQRQLLRRTTSVGAEQYTPRSGRRTASSHFMDSSERVYADILARPLEHVMAWSEPRVSLPAPVPVSTPAPALRDDVGWPLASRERGWV